MRRWSELLLTLLLTLALLVSCGAVKPSGETTAPPDEPVVLEDIKLADAGDVLCSVVRSKDSDTTADDVAAASSVTSRIRDLSGSVEVISKTDQIRRDQEYDRDTLEILVGPTAYPESAELYQNLAYGDYAVAIIGHKIVLGAYSKEGYSLASRALIAQIDAGEKDGTITLSRDAFPISGTVNEMMNALPHYPGDAIGVGFRSTNDVREIILHDTNADEFASYCNVIEQSGYARVAENAIADNRFATFENDAYTVNAGYYPYESGVRVMIEPKQIRAVKDTTYRAVTTPQLTMIGVEFTESSGNIQGNGMSILIRLSDGRFIVIDGGRSAEEEANFLLNQLREQSKAYAQNDSEITIAAWIFTHSHGDHIGMFNKYYTRFSKMKIEQFLVNFLSDEERNRAVNSEKYKDNFSAGEGTGHSTTIKAANKLGVPVRTVHTGERFVFADMDLQVLFTYENRAPTLLNAINATSVIMRMEVQGCVYMSLGDATGDALNTCCKTYGDYLRSDIVQTAHHGYTTWGNDSGAVNFYRTVTAPTVVWPQGAYSYPSHASKAYNKILFTYAKEVFVAGKAGDITILPLPYHTGGWTGKAPTFVAE